MINLYERAMTSKDDPTQHQVLLERDLQQFFRITPPLKIETEFSQISGAVDKQFFYLHLSLKVIEELDVEPVQAFALLEALRGIIYEKFNTITSRFIGKPLIENSKINEVMFDAIDLFSRFTATYDSVIDEAKHFGESQAFIMGSAIHRALTDKSRLVLCYLQLYQDVPEATWKHINRLYIAAQTYNIANQVIADKHQLPNHALSIKQLYLYSMLLACSGTNTLVAADIRALAELLKDWITLVQAQPQSRFKQYDNPLCVDPQLLSVPVFHQQLECSDSRSLLIFDFSKLKQKLNKSHVVQSFVNGKRYVLSSTAANQILRQWLQPYQRQHPRNIADSTQTLALALGVQDSWSPTMQPGNYSEFTAHDFGNRKLDFNRHFNDTSLQAITSQQQLTAVTHVQVVDESANGYGLQWPASFAHKLQHGQLLILNDIGSQQFSLGQLVWLRQKADKTLLTGVAVLADQVAQVYVTALARNGGVSPNPVQAFLGVQREGFRETFELIAPANQLAMGQLCLIDQGGQPLSAQLLELCQQTELYQRFNLAFYEQ